MSLLSGSKATCATFFVRVELKGIELTSPYSASLVETFPLVLGTGKAKPVCHLGSKNPMDAYKEALTEKFGSSVLPAFLVKDKNIFIEVKIDGKPDLKEEQKAEFGKVLEKGHRIFVIAPKISMKARVVKAEKFECHEFLGGDKRKKISLADIKKFLKK